ncbi:unnamed protein product [Prorocentrum cordatum]|uniref:Uncharacterized protein n=1 Tax=Prorocentrum cordatum TaxID=2364126 RepID=A0ABN9UJK7_9DINO|nr:unnamed protein product [Polarella glacialis]
MGAPQPSSQIRSRFGLSQFDSRSSKRPFANTAGPSPMTSRILLPCLLLGLAEATAFPSCEATTTGASPEETTAEPAPDIPLELQVHGQSGKFTLVPKGSSGASVGLGVTMDALREVDADGNEVGTSGAVKHSINTFASQDFTVGDMETVRIGSGVSAAKVSFDSTISEIGRIGVDTYVMAQSRTVGMSNESWDVNIGDLKWNIRLWDWTWCVGSSCKQGEIEQVGAFVELDITVQNLGVGAPTRAAGSPCLWAAARRSSCRPRCRKTARGSSCGPISRPSVPRAARPQSPFASRASRPPACTIPFCLAQRKRWVSTLVMTWLARPRRPHSAPLRSAPRERWRFGARVAREESSNISRRMPLSLPASGIICWVV